MTTNNGMNNELIQLLKGMAILNVIVFIIISIAFGFELSMLFGLILGYGIASLNLIALSRAITTAVKKDTSKAQKYMTANYLIRYLGVGIIIFISLKTEMISTIGVIIPLFYARLFMFLGTIIKRKGDK